MAGQTLNLSIGVVDVRAATAQEKKHGYAHDAHGTTTGLASRAGHAPWPRATIR